MSNQYITHLKELFSDIHEDIMKDLRDSDKVYSQLLSEHTKESLKLQEIYQLLDEENRTFVLNNLDCYKRIEWIEKETLYFQGYKDCIELLKFLSV